MAIEAGEDGSAMKNTGDLSTWSMKQLLKEDRRWGVNDMNGTDVRADGMGIGRG
jgi:hypothetical protein